MYLVMATVVPVTGQQRTLLDTVSLCAWIWPPATTPGMMQELIANKVFGAWEICDTPWGRDSLWDGQGCSKQSCHIHPGQDSGSLLQSAIITEIRTLGVFYLDIWSLFPSQCERCFHGVEVLLRFPLIHSDVEKPICYFSAAWAMFQNQARPAAMLTYRSCCAGWKLSHAGHSASLDHWLTLLWMTGEALGFRRCRKEGTDGETQEAVAGVLREGWGRAGSNGFSSKKGWTPKIYMQWHLVTEERRIKRHFNDWLWKKKSMSVKSQGATWQPQWAVGQTSSKAITIIMNNLGTRKTFPKPRVAQ